MVIKKTTTKKVVTKKSLPKAEDGKSLGTGSYIISNNGRIGRTNGLHGPYESMDTTGYSKGKKEFILKSSLSGYKPTYTKISRKESLEKLSKVRQKLPKRGRQKTKAPTCVPNVSPPSPPRR